MYLKAAEESIKYKNIKIINKIDFSKKFDRVTCLEVMEHLTADEQIRILQECKDLYQMMAKLLFLYRLKLEYQVFSKI